MTAVRGSPLCYLSTIEQNMMKKIFFTLMVCLGFAFAHLPIAFSQDSFFNYMSDEKSGDIVGSLATAEEMDDGYVVITRGKSKVLEVNRDIADVLVADPSIVEVGALKNNRLYLIGSALGDTNVMVFDGTGNPIQKFDVHVRIDEKTLQQTLERLFPTETINAKTVNENIVLTGNASSSSVAARIQEVAARFSGNKDSIINMIAVEGEQQVMIKVKVLEVARTVLNELGIEGSAGSSSSGGRFSGNVGTTNNFGLNVAPSFVNGGLAFTNRTTALSLLFRALERDGLVSTLAEPNLTAVSGQNARFLAGGEFPIPADIDDRGNVSYEYKPFGVSLAFKPVVMSGDRINLQVSTEVSDISDEYSLQRAGLTIPGFDVRRAETNVELASGGTLMMAGLIEAKSLNRLNRVPGIKDVPILGALANSESFTRNESELVIMITSYLVKPFADKTQVDEKPSESQSPLNQVMLGNLRKIVGHDKINSASNGKPVGYLLD